MQATILKDYDAKTGEMGGKVIAAGQTVFVPPPLMMPPPMMMAPVPLVQPAVQFVPVATATGTQPTGHLIATTNSQISGLWRPQETIGRLSMSSQDQSSNPSSPGNPSSPSAPGGIGGNKNGSGKPIDVNKMRLFISAEELAQLSENELSLLQRNIEMGGIVNSTFWSDEKKIVKMIVCQDQCGIKCLSIGNYEGFFKQQNIGGRHSCACPPCE